MGLFFRHNINEFTRLAVWKIEEDKDFFLKEVPLKRDINHPNKMLQHLAGRYLLKVLYPDFPYEEIEIAETRKPYLPGDPYHFSISHGANFAAAIVSTNQRVGIDIELFAEKLRRIEHKFLDEDELEFVPDEGENSDDIPMLTTLWCTKETVYKWWSYGNISLKGNIKIRNIEEFPEDLVHVDFLWNENEFPVQVNFKLFDEMALSWLVE